MSKRDSGKQGATPAAPSKNTPPAKTTPPDQSQSQSPGQSPSHLVEGEGSYEATRRHREHLEKFLAENDPRRLAREAAEEVDRDGEALREAERRGKEHIAEEDPELHRHP